MKSSVTVLISGTNQYLLLNKWYLLVLIIGLNAIKLQFQKKKEVLTINKYIRAWTEQNLSLYNARICFSEFEYLKFSNCHFVSAL